MMVISVCIVSSTTGQHGVESWITVLLVSIGAHEEVGHEEDHDDSYQRKLFFENKELGIVHIY